MQDDEDVVLVADIGGTNCRFVLWRLDSERGNHEFLFQKIYPTKDYRQFDDALDELAQEDIFRENTPGAAAFACAGPVLDNRCVMTNLSWVIDGDALTKKYGIRMAVLNDFEACGYGVPALKEKDYIALNNVKARPMGPKAVMGPGTGLGQANLYWSQNLDGYRVWPSEGSHSSFAPRGWKQRALQTFVERQLGYCEVEHVACGSGLERIYEFMQTDEHCIRPHLDMTQKKSAAEISKTALDCSDALAIEAVDLFCAIIGAEAGHMGLRSLASGGVYICGGIMPKLMERVKLGGLLESYLHDRSRFSRMLSTFPLYVVVNEGLGLLGTREYAIRLLNDPEGRKTKAPADKK
eukprot:jgi/Astpho2/7788/e_gw1.00117.63.1_t